HIDYVRAAIKPAHVPAVPDALQMQVQEAEQFHEELCAIQAAKNITALEVLREHSADIVRQLAAGKDLVLRRMDELRGLCPTVQAPGASFPVQPGEDLEARRQRLRQAVER